MRQYKLIIIMVFSFPWSLSAQENLWYERNFASYAEYLSKEFGILCCIPERFTDLDKYYFGWKVREAKDKHVGNLYGPVFQSKDRGCLLMYPARPRYISEKDIEGARKTALIERVINGDTTTSEPNASTNQTIPRGQISGEIRTALGLFYRHGHSLNNDSALLNLNDYLTVISGKKAHEMFNADSILIYDIPGADSVYILNSSLEKLRERKYPYCTGFYIIKDGRATMDFKLFFTERARKKEKKYIDMLNKQVWYDENFIHE
jgi:hypothetical protein